MKKNLFFLIVAFIISSAIPVGAVKKVEAHPINVAVMLTQETDTAKIASTLDYYGYTREPQGNLTPDTPTPDTNAVFTHPNGSRIRYTLPSGDKYPTIEVKTKATAKEKDKILKNLNFQKTAKGYEKKSIGHTTTCTPSTNGTLLLTKGKTSPSAP